MRASQLTNAICGGLLLALGCSAQGGDGGIDAPSGQAGTSSTPPPGSAGGPSTAELGRDAVAARCETSQLAPPQLRRLTARELERTLRAVFPTLPTTWSVRLGADPVSPLGFSNDARTLLVASQTAQELLGTAEDVADALVQGGLASLAACAADAGAGQACAEQLAQSVGAKLFRRPLSATEVSEYGALGASIASKSDFATGARWLLVSLIQSPNAVYRSELGSAGHLDGYELASELSYTFSGGPPSAELLDSAQRGELATGPARVAVAKQLLASPGGREQLHQFLAEWSGYGRVASKTKTTVTDFETLRGSMQEETKRFLEEAVVTRQGGVRELLTANYTFVDANLSRLYGFGSATGAAFVLAQRPAGQGLGLLAQGSILAGSAHADSSSPTLRGLVLYERLMCHQKPTPIAMIPTLEAPAPGAKTTRERYEISHGGKGGCSACHRYFDPLGFGFEHFDEAGRYRSDEQGLAIDASGRALSYPDGELAFTFDGQEDLVTQLANQPEVADCVSGLVAAYAFAGAGGRTCLAEDARAAFARGESGLLDYFAQLAASPSFVDRAP